MLRSEGEVSRLLFPLKSRVIAAQCGGSVEATISFKEQGDCYAVLRNCQDYGFPLKDGIIAGQCGECRGYSFIERAE